MSRLGNRTIPRRDVVHSVVKSSVTRRCELFKDDHFQDVVFAEDNGFTVDGKFAQKHSAGKIKNNLYLSHGKMFGNELREICPRRETSVIEIHSEWEVPNVKLPRQIRIYPYEEDVNKLTIRYYLDHDYSY